MKTKNVGKLFSIVKKYDFFKVLNYIPTAPQTKGIIYFPFAQDMVSTFMPAFNTFFTIPFNNTFLMSDSLFEDSETVEATILNQQ